MRKHLMLIMVALCGLLGMTVAQGTESYALWLKRMPITFSGYTPPGGGAALTNFPALVVLSNTTAGVGFDYDEFLSPPYGDLRFAAADKVTPLDFEVESWDTAGASYVWVRVPELTAETTIYALWGKSGVDAPDCTTNGAVWNAGFAGVWHMTGSGNKLGESTANKRVGTLDSSGVAFTDGGYIGGAALFTGTGGSYSANGGIDCGDMLITGPQSVAMWLKTANLGRRSPIGKAYGGELTFSIYESGLVYFMHGTSGGDAQPFESHATPVGAVKIGEWVHLMHVRDTKSPATLHWYVNGVCVSTMGSSYTETGKSTRSLLLGKGWNDNFNGVLDEVRVSDVARPAEWVWAEYQNMASNGVFNSYGGPELQESPFVAVGGVTNTTIASAWITGTLVSTGTSDTAVSAYWGRSDGGGDADAWEGHTVVGTAQLPGIFSAEATGLTAGTNYYARFMASNEAGGTWSDEVLYFITADVWVEAVSAAAETGLIPGTAMVHRAASAAAEALEVNYSLGGTATAGEDYVALSGKVVILAGETSAVIEIMPLFDHLLEGTEMVELTLLPGAYVVGTENQAAVGIVDHGRVTRTWRGAVSALASVAGNWAEGEVPVVDDKVVLDVTAASKPLTWDLDIVIGAWRQTADYSGTVTFTTVYPDQGGFTNFVVNSDVELLGGTWTHTANSGGDVAVNRLCVTVGGDFTLGAAASINLDGRGYAAAKGPGAGNSAQTTSARSASHGGRGAENLAGKGTYGSPVWPESLGSGAYSAGGGALRLAVGGAATLDGQVKTRGVNSANNNYCHGAGGSILITAGTIGGVGQVSAGIDIGTRSPYHGSGGGRIALHALASADFSGLTIDTYAYAGSRSGYNGGAGTIYLSAPDGARLIVDQGGYTPRAGAYTELPAASAEFVLDPALGGELADAALVVTNGAVVSLLRDLRLGDVAWLNGDLRLNSWTLYAKADAPEAAFPSKYGNGTISSNGVFFTFDDGQALTRAGRLLWFNSNVTWRVESHVRSGSGGAATFDGGQTSAYCAHGSEPEFTAAPIAGYEFIRWDGALDSGSISVANPLALAPLTGNKALRAWFLDEVRDFSTNAWLAAQSSTDWFDPRNWSLGSVPVAGQTVIVPTGAKVILTNATPQLVEFVLNGGSFSFDGWEACLKATTINLTKGTVTHEANTAAAEPWLPNARVWLDCVDLVVASAAAINADSKGFAAGDVAGCGPGGGYNLTPADHYQTGGGGHGGRGGRWQLNVSSGQAYGDAAAPILPGSGGCNVGSGKPGGGVIRISASGHVIVNGSVTAHGGGAGAYGAGGAGGSVWITCETLASDNGVVGADGGNANTVNTGGGGGGGRVAIAYQPQAQSNMPPAVVRLSARGGTGTRIFNLGTAGIGNPDGYGELGTIHLPDAQLVRTPLRHSGNLMITGFKEWSLPALEVTEGWCRFPPGFDLRVDGAVALSGGSTRLDLTDSQMSCASLSANAAWLIFDGQEGTARVFRCDGDLVLTNKAQLHVKGGIADPEGAEWGVLIDIGGILSVATNCIVRPWAHPVAGDAPLFRVRRLNLAAGATFDANYIGYPRGLGRGGFGPGGGYSPKGDNYGNGGGGYGGRGGRRYTTDPGGGTYGSSNAPVRPGSGGGGSKGGYIGQDGGGLIWVEAEREITLNGSMTANGGAAGAYGSGGAGGGIYLRCARLEGSGATLSAKGGGSDKVNSNGAGGGGRIAVWRTVHHYDGLPAASANGGVGCYNGEDGTIVWGWIPAQGTIILLR